MQSFVRSLKEICNPALIIMIIVIILLGIAYLVNIWNMSVKANENEAMLFAMAAESGFQKSAVNKLNADLSDLEKTEYKEIKNSLSSLAKQKNQIRFAYIYVQRNDKIFFLADSEPEDSEDYSPPGQEYSEANAETFLPFQTGQTLITKPYTDRWGKWVSVLVPMKNMEDDKTVAVFTVAYPAESWNDKAIIRTIQAGITVFFVLIIFIAIYIVLIQDITFRKRKDQLLELDIKLKGREKWFKTIFDQAPIGISIGHLNDKYVASSGNSNPIINPMIEKITGRTKAELSNLRWIDITHPDDVALDLEYSAKLKSREIDGFEIEKRYIKPDGSEIWCHMVVVPMELNDTDEKTYICLIEDISKRKEIEKALYYSERSKAVLLDNLPGMAYRCSYDRDWTMQFVSAGFKDLTGYQAESLLYNKELSYNEIIDPIFRDTLWNEWERVLNLKIHFRYEYKIICANGEPKWVLEMGQGLFDDNGNVDALEGIIIDISEQKEREAQIKYISDHDFMTGVFNRRFYDQVLMKMDCEESLPLSILLMDINGVKLINDTFGFTEGDKLIKETAKIIQSCSRMGDIIARIAGDEFVMLLPNTEIEMAYNILNDIEKACISYNENNKSKLYEINLSIGCGAKVTSEESFVETTKMADEYLRNRKLLNRKSAHSHIIASMMAAVYEKSQETEEHAKRLAKLSKLIGEKLDLHQKTLVDLELFAMLHDIGKVGIDSRILNKQGKLTKDEWLVMQKHSEIGFRIAKSSSELDVIADYILTHHERWNGTGYPHGLKGEEIPLLSRILAVVDAYDAMTHDRIYRKALMKQEAIEEIKKNAGIQFDPHIAQVFIENI